LSIIHFYSYKNIFFLLALIFFSQSSFAGKVSSQSKLDEGVQAVYNFEFEKADMIFSAILKKNPNDLLANHFSATLSFWKYFGSNKKKYFDEFLNQSDATIAKAEQSLPSNPKNKETLFVLGAAQSYRAMAFGKAEKYLDMIWASKKANGYLSDVLEIDRNYYDAYLGIGLIKFALSQAPSGFKWALRMIGFDGDSEKGLSYIKLAAEKGKYSKIEAEYYLSQLYSEFYFDYEKAKTHLAKLNQSFPNNLLFDYSFAVIEVKEKNLSSAEKILLPLVKTKTGEFEQLLALSKFLLADVYFYRNNFGKAKEYYSRFLHETKGKNYFGIANYRLAICNEFLSEPNVEYYKAALRGNAELDDDYYAKKMSEVYLKRKMTEVEKSLIFFKNLLEQKQYDAAIDSLNVVLNNNEYVNYRPQIFLILSEAYYCKNNYDSSLNFSLKATTRKNSPEGWIKPFANYFASASCDKKNEKEKAKYYFEIADGCSDFFYENKLKSMLKKLSHSINN